MSEQQPSKPRRDNRWSSTEVRALKAQIGALFGWPHAVAVVGICALVGTLAALHPATYNELVWGALGWATGAVTPWTKRRNGSSAK